jgi:hypothetical protein
MWSVFMWHGIIYSAQIKSRRAWMWYKTISELQDTLESQFTDLIGTDKTPMNIWIHIQRKVPLGSKNL